MACRRTSRREVSYGEQGLRLLPITRFKGLPFAQYWRIAGITLPSGGDYLEISELQFFEGATQKTGTLTSFSAPVAGTVSQLGDGILTARPYWTAAAATNASFWIRIDLGSPAAISGIKQGGFDTASRRIGGCRVEYSIDGSSWQTRATLSGLTYPGNNTLSALIPF